MDAEIVKIQTVFLGRAVKGIHMAIITPIPHIYNDVYQLLKCEDEASNGFLRNAYFGNSKTKGILICCSQGVAAQDAVVLFSDIQIFFIGYAGSLSKELTIGTPIEVKKVICNLSENYMLQTKSDFKKASIAYSPCFLGTTAMHAHYVARQYEAQCVDMETVHCAKAAYDCKNSLSSLLLITDMPNIVDVWYVDEQMKTRIDEGYHIILRQLHKLINNDQRYE